MKRFEIVESEDSRICKSCLNEVEIFVIDRSSFSSFFLCPECFMNVILKVKPLIRRQKDLDELINIANSIIEIVLIYCI